MTAIHAAVSLVAAGAYGPLPQPVQRLLEIAAENSERMVKLTSDLIDLERTNLGKLVLDWEQCDGAELARHAVDSVATIAAASGVSVQVAAQPVSFRADPTRLAQVLTNLLANAIKFSDEGSPVTLAVGQRDDQARFEVIDHGRGIEASELERIFARFHQVDKSDARRAGGWGLGLAIAKAIVDEHRGRIWVESEVGRGATFIFEVPVAPPETA